MRFTPFAFLGQSFLVEYLIVGGGAAGGPTGDAFGGGGGGVISGSTTTYQGDIFNIIIGAGGTPSSRNGQTSSLQIKSATTYSIGGGNGTTSGNGYVAGGTATCGGLTVYGGGGGAGVNGSNGLCLSTPVQTPGNGGNGVAWLNGIYYGGGGGAGNSKSTEPRGINFGVGGLGGGGNGGYTSNISQQPVQATSGLDGFGGAGGGAGSYGANTAGNGGSGSVIIRYQAPQKAIGGNSVFESGSYVYHTFTSNGTLTT
jgi:hypothetical protein